MKPYIDMFETMKYDFITNKKLRSRMLTYWGTEYIDGVKVFKKQVQIYPNPTANAKKILQTFGALKEVEKADFDGLKRFWMFLNPAKLKGLKDVEASMLAEKLNGFLPLGETYTFSLNVYDTVSPNNFVGWTAQQILTYVDANYKTLVDSIYTQVKADTIGVKAIGPYVLLDDENIFEVSITEARVTYVKDTQNISPSIDINVYNSAISLDLVIKRVKTITAVSTIVRNMLLENDQIKKQATSTVWNSQTNTLTSVTSYSTVLFAGSSGSQTDYLWYKGQLRADTTNYNYLDRDDFMKVVQDSMDTDYEEEDTEWWEDLLAVILFVIAIILVPFTGGQSLTAFGIYMGTITLVLTLVQLLLSALGIQGAVLMLGKIIQITGILSLVAGIGATLKNIAKLSLDSLMNFSNVIKILNKALEFRLKMQMEQFDATKSQLEGEIAKQEEELAEMNDKEYHLGVEDIRFYTRPLTNDNNAYEIDYLYEGTKHNVLRPSFYPFTGLNIIT